MQRPMAALLHNDRNTVRAFHEEHNLAETMNRSDTTQPRRWHWQNRRLNFNSDLAQHGFSLHIHFVLACN
jgi:hypothetical protein